MASKTLRLGDVEPRERAGSRTGRRYEYQYERTARATLDLLVDEPKQVCVFCDWHDDYVVEAGDPPTRYVFHQVKGRQSSEGPWTFNDFFGVRKKKAKGQSKEPPTVKADAIVPLMLSHYRDFGDNCAGLVFITNAGIHPDLSEFLESLATTQSDDCLPEEALAAFNHIVRAYQSATPQIAPGSSTLFAWLRGVKVCTDQGQLDDGDAALLELADRVVQLSEIDLVLRQAKQIAREVVSQVRRKVSHTTTIVPAPDEKLRQDKGIVTSELLGVLSLSAQAYEELRAGVGVDHVKTLSRLQRFCMKNNLENLIVPICGFKAQWDVWRTVERHFLNSADFVLLQQRAFEALRPNLTIDQLVAEAKDISKQFADITATPLMPEHVLGLVFALAAQAEALIG